MISACGPMVVSSSQVHSVGRFTFGFISAYLTVSRFRCTLSTDTEPVVSDQRSRRSASDSENELLSYASSMISTLRLQRDGERFAHKQTREQADSRIAILEGQLASREAELEAYAAHTDICIRRSHEPTPFRGDSSRKPMTNPEIIRSPQIDSTLSNAPDVQLEGLEGPVRPLLSLASSAFSKEITLTAHFRSF